MVNNQRCEAEEVPGLAIIGGPTPDLYHNTLSEVVRRSEIAFSF
jgi:hypothetical protein